jgi:hypothetical protein
MKNDLQSNQKQAKSSRQVVSFYPPPGNEITTPWKIEVYSVKYEPERWRQHKLAADRTYTHYRVETVEHDREAAIQRSPTFFSEATIDGIPVGGARIHLLSSLGRLPIQEELERFVDNSQLEHLIRELAPQGLVHGAGLWIDPILRGSGLAGDLGRSLIPMIHVTKARYCIGTAHQYVVSAWCSLGFQPVASFPRFPYPDERYQTCIVLNDRQGWPADLGTWAFEQAKGAILEGPGARFSINPMRAQISKSTIL